MSFSETLTKLGLTATYMQHAAARLLEREGQKFLVDFGLHNCLEKAVAVVNEQAEAKYEKYKAEYPALDYPPWIRNQCPLDGGVFFVMSPDHWACQCYICGTEITEAEFMACLTQESFDNLVVAKNRLRPMRVIISQDQSGRF